MGHTRSMYEIHERPMMTRPILVAGFDGWINAGGAATNTLAWIADGAEPFVTFEGDRLFDYRDQRPIHEIREGVIEDFEWPSVTMTHVERGGRDLVILSGTEPALNWQAFVGAVADLALDLDVVELIGIGGIPWAVPHTRPIPVLTTASDRSLIPDQDEHPEGIIRVPAAVSRAIEVRLTSEGIPAMGFWARVPQYVGVDLHAAALAILARLGSHLGIVFDVSELMVEADAQREHLDAIASARPDLSVMIEKLESIVDVADPADGEQLASEIERFLRNRPDDDGLAG